MKTNNDKEEADYTIEEYRDRGGSDISEELFMFLCGPDPTWGAVAEQGRHRADTAERRLLIALLEDTVYQISKQRRGMSEQEAENVEECKRWLAGQIRGTAISFEFVCDVLGMHREYFLKRLGRLTDIRPGRWRPKPKAVNRRARPNAGRPEKREVPDGVQLRG